MNDKEPLLDKMVREKGWATKPSFWLGWLEDELEDIEAGHRFGQKVSHEVLAEAVRQLALKLYVERKEPDA